MRALYKNIMISCALNVAKTILLEQSTIHADAKVLNPVVDWMDQASISHGTRWDETSAGRPGAVARCLTDCRSRRVLKAAMGAMPSADVTEARREIMRSIKGKNTKPEMAVRRLIHGLGYRYRLHCRELPGKPDLAFGPRRRVIFIHGCFWHRHSHPACPLARLPKSRLEFWLPKLEGNRARDIRNLEALERAGWRALTIWECQLRDMDMVTGQVLAFLGPRGREGTDGC